jgi:hypothetical protein
MVLLSQAIRTAAITGSSDSFFSRIVGRQGGRWAQQTVGAAFPPQAPAARRTSADPVPAPRDPAETLRELTQLRERGIITDDELEHLRTRLRV